MKEKYIKISMKDGTIFLVPGTVIAHDKAVHLAKKSSILEESEEFQKIYAEELASTIENDRELINHATMNMNWEELKHHAFLIHRPIGPVTQKEFLEASFSIMTRNTSIEETDHE